jgi:uncharacterized protein YkwD
MTVAGKSEGVSMRALTFLAVMLAMLAHGLAQTKSVPAKAGPATAPKMSASEKALFDAANRERAARKLAPLKWNASLASAARAHARKMAQENRLEHQFPREMDLGTRIRVAGVPFTAVAENVAQGPSAAGIHAQWMNSPPHRANLLDPELDSIGIAVAEGKGQLFAVQDFAAANP